VNDRERVKLLFGPYQAPPLSRGDRVTCLFRDCLVIITGWSAGPIPWLRCRALDSAGAGARARMAAPLGTPTALDSRYQESDCKRMPPRI
jgi:hypothetical protein